MSEFTDFANIPLSQVEEPEHKLRELNVDSEEYAELVKSVEAKGVIEPIQVVDRGDGVYLIVNGLHRYHASIEAGKETIPCRIIDADEREQRRIQLVTNAVRVKTRPAEYAKILREILEDDPLLTATSLAKDIGKSPNWIMNRLKLTGLADDVATMVDNGEINLANATKLAELSEEVQDEYVQDAKVLTSDEFTKIIDAKVAQIAAANASGNASAEPVFILKAKRRLVQELEKFADNPELVDNWLSDVAYNTVNLATAGDGFLQGILYALSLDPVTASEKEAEWNENLQGKEEKRKQRRLETLEKKKKLKEKQLQLEEGRIAVEIDAINDGKSPEEVEAVVQEYLKANDMLPKPKKKKEEPVQETEPVSEPVSETVSE